MSFLEATRDLAFRLTAIPSVNGSQGELDVLAFLHDRLANNAAFRAGRLVLHVIPCPQDPIGRGVLLAHLRGTSGRGVMLLGHVDTVGVSDYGELAPYAFDPPNLTSRAAAGELGDDAKRRAEAGWIFGRGMLDMKAGLAAALMTFESFAVEGTTNHLLFAVTPDEEAGSRGALTLGPWLEEYERGEGFHVGAVLNTDCTPMRRGDAGRKVIYLGSIGKTLLGVHVQGQPSHVGDPGAGVDPNAVIACITNRVVYETSLTDREAEEVTPVPVSLYQRDDKPFYDVQTPVSASAYYNVFHLGRTPGEQLGRFQAQVEDGVSDLADRYHRAHGNRPPIAVHTFAELWSSAPQALQDRIKAADFNQDSDVRRICQRASALLLSNVHPGEAAAVVYFASDLVPAVSSGEQVRQAVEDAIRQREAVARDRFTVQRYFPYISDLSFFGPSKDWDDSLFPCNYPAIALGHRMHHDAFHTATVMVGAYGIGAHRRDESVDPEYSFEALPSLLRALILRLWVQDR